MLPTRAYTPERGTSAFRLQAYEMVGQSVIFRHFGLSKIPKGLKYSIMVVKSLFIYSYFKKTVHLQQLKGCKVLNYRMYEKGVPFVNRGYTGGKKMGIKWEKAALN